MCKIIYLTTGKIGEVEHGAIAFAFLFSLLWLELDIEIKSHDTVTSRRERVQLRGFDGSVALSGDKLLDHLLQVFHFLFRNQLKRQITKRL